MVSNAFEKSISSFKALSFTNWERTNDWHHITLSCRKKEIITLYFTKLVFSCTLQVHQCNALLCYQKVNFLYLSWLPASRTIFIALSKYSFKVVSSIMWAMSIESSQLPPVCLSTDMVSREHCTTLDTHDITNTAHCTPKQGMGNEAIIYSALNLHTESNINRS